MKQVKIISGTYGYRPEGAKFITPVKAGEVVEVSDAEAVRLAGLGVAVCIGASAPNVPPAPVATHGRDAAEGYPGENAPEGNGGTETPVGGDPEADDTLDIVDGHFTVASLLELTRTNMEKLADDLGVDVSKCKNKPDIAALLANVELESDETEGNGAPPVPSVEAPVV